MSVTDVEKRRGPLYKSRNASSGVTDTEKMPGHQFPGDVTDAEKSPGRKFPGDVEGFGTCEHGNPLLGRCGECAAKRVKDRKERAVLAEAAQQTAKCCGKCGRALSPTDPVFIRGLPIYRGRSQVPVCEECAHLDSYHNYLQGQCEQCGRMVTSEYLNRPRRKYSFCCEACRTIYLNALHNNQRKQRNARYREKTCEVCGESFTATRRDAKHCSLACKQKAYRARKARGAHSPGPYICLM